MRNGVFTQAYIALIALEGGYANVATDRGGETYRGISRRFWPDWEGWMLVDSLKEPGDSNSDINETLENSGDLAIKVQAFYRKNFWEPLNCDLLPELIAEELFDTAVNQGVGTAAKYLQEAVNLLNLNGKIFKDIKVDGAIGPMSLAAFDAVRISIGNRYGVDRFQRTFIKVLDGLQFERYRSIVERDQSQEVNFFGWVSNRVGNVG